MANGRSPVRSIVEHGFADQLSAPALAPETAPIGVAEPLPRGASQSLDLSHARIAIRQTFGPGVPLLFLHGNSSAKEVFDLQIDSPLGQNHRCIALDLPGHGASSDAHEPQQTYSISGLADAAIETLEALDIDQVVVVGWSLGGHVALEMVASFPGVVGAMIVGAPPVRSGVRGLLSGFRLTGATPLLGARELTPAQAMELGRVSVGEHDAAEFLETTLRTDGRLREMMFRSLFRGEHTDQRRTVETSDAAIAVVVGEDDPLVRASAYERPNYANLWSGACHLIPGGGHAPFRAAAPLFNQLLGQFARDMDIRASQLRETPQLMYSG